MGKCVLFDLKYSSKVTNCISSKYPLIEFGLFGPAFQLNVTTFESDRTAVNVFGACGMVVIGTVGKIFCVGV